MGLDVEKEIKIYFALQFIGNIIFGLWEYISPETSLYFYNHPFWDPSAVRFLAAFWLAGAFISLKGLKDASEWEKVENLIYYGIISLILLAIAVIINYIIYVLPIGYLIVYLVLFLSFLILATHILMRKPK